MNNERQTLQESIDNPTPLAEFVALLERCQRQVKHDPSGYTENPHLYGALHHVFLRLCHGNIPDFGVD